MDGNEAAEGVEFGGDAKAQRIAQIQAELEELKKEEGLGMGPAQSEVDSHTEGRIKDLQEELKTLTEGSEEIQ